MSISLPMFSVMDGDNDSCVCVSVSVCVRAPAAGESWDLCDLQPPKHANKSLSLVLQGEDKSQAPAATRGAHWRATPTVKHFISNLPRAHMIIFPVTPVFDRLQRRTATCSSFTLGFATYVNYLQE